MKLFNKADSFASGKQFKDKVPFQALLQSLNRCSLVYEEPDIVQKYWLAPEENPTFTAILKGVSSPKYVTSPPESDEDAQAYLWTDDTSVYVTFRGSSSLDDFVADADVISKELFDDDRNIYVHRGFLKQFLSIEPQITAFLKNDPKAQALSTILVAGHSLGGGCAHIAAPFYGEMFNGQKQPKKTVACHTYGSPRAGNKAFVDWFHQNVVENYRVSNYQDPIPTIPLRPLWRHVKHTCILMMQMEAKQFLFFGKKQAVENKFLMRIQEHDVPFWIRIWAPLLCITQRKLLAKQFPEHNTAKFYYPRLISFIEEVNDEANAALSHTDNSKPGAVLRIY